MIYETAKMTPRDRRRNQKIDAILTVATDLALQGGLEAITIHGVAKALDYTPGALYRYFESKAQLLAALHLRLIRQLSTRIHEVWDSADAFCESQNLGVNEQGAVKLFAVSLAMNHFAVTEPGPFRIIVASFAHPRHMLDPTSAVNATSGYLALVNDISEPITILQGTGFFAPGNSIHRAITLLTGTHSLLQLEKVSRLAPDLFSTQPLVREFFLTLLRGWSTDPTASTSLLGIFSNLEEHLSSK